MECLEYLKDRAVHLHSRQDFGYNRANVLLKEIRRCIEDENDPVAKAYYVEELAAVCIAWCESLNED